MEKKSRRQHSPEDKGADPAPPPPGGQPIFETCEAEASTQTLFYQWHRFCDCAAAS